MGRTVRKVKNPGGNGNDTAVQGTNDSSIVSKCSMVDAGYFKDDFVNHFVNKRSRRSPLINRGYYVRAAAMEHVFQGFFEIFQHEKKQIVSLGAGFDSAYFRLKSQGHLQNTTYLEVDFPELMQRKKALIQTSPALKEMLSEVTEISPDIILDCTDYKLLGVDLTQLDLLDQCLAAANIDQSLPTLILSEVVLTYLDPQGSSSIIQWMAAYFECAVFASYEQVLPYDSFGIVMMNHFCKLRSPLRTIDTFPSGDSQVQRYTKLGWSCTIAVDMNYFYTSVLTSPERQRVESLEPFDEFEEWHLKCSHYIMLTAFKGACLTLKDTLWPHISPDAETTGKVFIHDTSMRVGDSSHPPTDGDGGMCVSCGVVTSQSQTQCRHCSGADLTLGSLRDSAVPCHRTNTVVTHGKDIGNDGSNSSTSAESEIRDGAVEWTRLPPVEGTQRFGHSSAVVGSHFIVTVGGFGADGGRHCRMRTLLAHHVLSGTVVDVKVTREHGRDIGNPFECMYHTLTPVGSTSLLLFGGRLSPTRPCLQSFLLKFGLGENQNSDTENGTEDVPFMHGDVTTLGTGNVAEIGRCVGPEHCSTPDSDQNTVRMKCVCQKLPTEDACPSPRWRHSAVSISIDDSPHVVVFGGMSDSQTAFNDCYMFDVQRHCWSKLECKGETPEPRHSHTASHWSGCMVVACGIASDLLPLKSIFRLDIISRKWTEVTILGNSLRPRYSHAATLIGDCLALVGGVCLTLPPPGVDVVNLVTGVHQEYVMPQQDSSNPIMLHGNSGISSIPLLTERQIVVVGGGGNCFSFGTHLNATPVLLTLPDESRET